MLALGVCADVAAFADIKTRMHESAKYVRFSGRTFSSKRPLSAILSAKWIAEMKSRRDFASKRILPGHFCEVDLRSFSPLFVVSVNAGYRSFLHVNFC